MRRAALVILSAKAVVWEAGPARSKSVNEGWLNTN